MKWGRGRDGAWLEGEGGGDRSGNAGDHVWLRGGWFSTENANFLCFPDERLVFLFSPRAGGENMAGASLPVPGTSKLKKRKQSVKFNKVLTLRFGTGSAGTSYTYCIDVRV